MSSAFVFPYSITLEAEGRVEIVPTAEVGFLSHEGEWLTLILLIDSGAVASALPKSDAVAFGIDLEKGRQAMIAGIAGQEVKGWEHTVRVRLGGELLEIPLLFVDSDTTPRVLGREGIFDRFTIVFEEAKRRTGWLDPKSPQAKAAGQMLNEIESA